MLTASINDGPAFHTRSHTQSISDPTSIPPVIPQPHISQDDTPMPKTLTADQQDALLQMPKNRSLLQMHLQKTIKWQSPTS